MLEINSYLLQKMGWTKYGLDTRFLPHRLSDQKYDLVNLFNDDDLVRYFLIDMTRKLCFLIKEMSEDEKQKQNYEYKFIRFYITEDLESYLCKKKYTVDLEKINFVIDPINTNKELMKLLIKNEAGNENYKRHWKLLKLLNK